MNDTSGNPDVRVAIVADDLSGAADSAVAFTQLGRVLLGLSPDLEQSGAAEVVCLDADTRHARAREAETRTCRCIERVLASHPSFVFKKVDSTLRGHVGIETAAALGRVARDAGDGRAVALIAPAFPAMGRTTSAGCQRKDGDALAGAAGDIAGLLHGAGLHSGLLDLDSVRGGSVLGLAERMDRAVTEGTDALVCDALVDADLDRIVAAAGALDHPLLYVGSAGLAHALARALGGAEAHPSVPAAVPGGVPLLVLAGSRTQTTRAQVRALGEEPGVFVTGIEPVDLLHARAEVFDRLGHWEAHLRAGRDLVLHIDEVDCAADTAVELVEALAELVIPLASAAGSVLATGGDMARSMLARLQVPWLLVRGELEPGVVLSRAERAPVGNVVTKAGGFGHPETLVRVRRWLHTQGAPAR